MIRYSRCHSDQHLSEVLTSQHAKERCGRLFQPVDDILAVFEATCAHPFADIAQEIGLFSGEVRDDESTQEQPFAQYRKHIGPGHRGRRIVLRDEPAYGNARKIVEQRPHRPLYGTADVLEVNVNALGTSGLELFCKIGRATIDTSIEAQLTDDEVALLCATGDPDRMASFDFSDLPDDRSDGAGGRRNNDGLPTLRLTDFEETDIGGHPRHTEDTERRRDRRRPRVELAQARPI